jgi:large subunit ribosomal protein L13
MKTIFLNPKKIEQKWYLIDAEGETLGSVAVKAANILRGKNKPYYTPHQNVGDFVIIINSEKAVLTGQKRKNKLYYKHSGYPGGLYVTNYEKMIAKKPTFPVEHAVQGMLPKNRLGRKLFRNLKVYAGTDHPHSAQKPEKI